MDKEELYKLLKQVKKDYEVVITWLDENHIRCSSIKQVKVNLTMRRVEFFISDY